MFFLVQNHLRTKILEVHIPHFYTYIEPSFKCLQDLVVGIANF